MNIRNGVENYNGVLLHYKNGRVHREDGPAKIWPDGTMEWWFNGEIHNEDGPSAIHEYIQTTPLKYTWHIHGVGYTFDDWCKKLDKTDEEIILLKLKYGDLEK